MIQNRFSNSNFVARTEAKLTRNSNSCRGACAKPRVFNNSALANEQKLTTPSVVPSLISGLFAFSEKEHDSPPLASYYAQDFEHKY